MEHTPNDTQLHWHDLSADDVYSIAHVEHEVRLQTAELLTSTAYANDPRHQLRTVQVLLANQETRSASWLADQRVLRGLAAVAGHSVAMQDVPRERSTARTIGDWLDTQLNSLEVSATDIANAAGTSKAYLSKLRNNHVAPTRPLMAEIAGALADEKGLQDEAREAFITEALVQAGHY
jgi:hypothetical protein